jgi:membrane fusion protein, multidrug efflux system
MNAPTMNDCRSPVIPGVLLALTALLSGCGRPHAPTTATAADLPPASVRLETIQARSLPVTEEVVGTVQSRHSVDIAAKVSGRILELPVVLGQSVKQGDLLVAIDSEDIRARLEQAEVALRQAEIDYRRADSLRQTGAATQAEQDAATSRFHSARAAVTEARAMLEHARISAPIDGAIARKEAQLGDLAMPGQLLLRLEDPLHLRLEAEVPNSLLDRVQTAASLPVRIDGISELLEGRVAEIAPVANPTTRSLRVKLDLPATPGLRPGQFGRVGIPLAEVESLVVPRSALTQRGQLDFVFVAVDGRARLRIVRTGRPLNGGIEILAGLHSGETVVVEDAAGLTDGQPLRPR